MSGHTTPATEELLRDYLQSLSIVPIATKALAGGNANFCWRVTLDHTHHESIPHLNSASTVIVKHAEPFVARNPGIPFPQDRMEFEAKSMGQIKALLSVGISVDKQVEPPTLYNYDESLHMLMMSDGGTQNLKDAYESLPSEAVRSIGSRLGHWLAALHQRSKSTYIGTDGNRTAKYVYQHAYRGLAGSIKHWSLDGQYPSLGSEINETYGVKLHTDDENVCMGDFWPGNVVIGDPESSSDDVVPLTVVDWEMTRRGIGATDVGQFLAEAYLLDRFRSVNKELAGSFFESYTSHIIDEENVALDPQYQRRVGIHAGTHLGYWPTSVKWAGDDETKKVVELGLQIITKARDESQDPQAWMDLLILQSLSGA